MLFQFTPLREGRRCPAARSTSAPIFQFTPLREGRRSALIGTSFGWMISIHAPPRGATRSLYRALALSAYFNSRPSARGDMSPADASTARLIFQFTPLREGRPNVYRLRLVRRHFNSRPSARGDFTAKSYYWQFYISIHAPPRGATLLEGRECFGGFISIHAPPRGATASHWLASPMRLYFNSRPSARGDAQGFCAVRINFISIHAPPRGATSQD